MLQPARQKSIFFRPGKAPPLNRRVKNRQRIQAVFSQSQPLSRSVGLKFLLTVASIAALALNSPVRAHASGSDYAQACLGKAADDTPVYPTEVIPSGEEIHTCFLVSQTQLFNKMTGALIAVDVGPVAPPNYQVASTDFQVGPADTASGSFHFTLPRPFPLGKYRTDISIDGKPWKSVAFTVVAPAADATAAALVPLNKGQVWNYSYVQQLGNGVKPSALPAGAKVEADGTIHNSVQIAVADIDNGTSHILLRRAGQPFSEEWWGKSAEGVVALKRKVDSQIVVLDPPQLMVRQPPLNVNEWEYVSKDGAIHQTVHEWGPLPIKYGSVQRSGYVVLVEQAGSLASTVERDYVPGVGMVRSTSITGKPHQLIEREDMILNQ